MDPDLSPFLPPGHSQVALVVIVLLILVFILILTGWLWGNDTGVSVAQVRPQPPPSRVPGSPTHPHSHSLPHCWLQRERERETESGEMGPILCQPSPLGPAAAYHHPSPAGKTALGGSSLGAVGISWESKGRGDAWDRALGQQGLQQETQPPIQGGKG